MKTQFNMTVAVDNIIAMRRKAKRNDVAAGVAWYANAYDACMAIALRYDVPVHIVVGVVAALSPTIVGIPTLSMVRLLSGLSWTVMAWTACLSVHTPP